MSESRNTIQVRMIKSWRGHPRGKVIVTNDVVAKALVLNGDAEFTRQPAKPSGRPPKREVAAMAVPERATHEQPKPREREAVVEGAEKTDEDINEESESESHAKQENPVKKNKRNRRKSNT